MGKTLFKNTSSYYSKYRLGYPQEFFDYVYNYFNLNENGRLLDLGCGTGQISIPFSTRLKEVIAIDPEEEMLIEAEEASTKLKIKNIKFIKEKAEDITNKLGVFNLTTIGAAFHWMNQVEVLQLIYNLTQQGGGIAIVNDSSSPWRDKPEEWNTIRKEIIQKYLGKKRRAGNSFFTNKSNKTFKELLIDSPFNECEEWIHEYTYEWTNESIINILYSTSFASKDLLGDKVQKFENELKTKLLEIEPSGVYKEKIQVEVLLAKK